VLILAVFVAFMNGGTIYKKPWSATDDVAAWLDTVGADIEADRWEKAGADADRLEDIGRTERGPRALEQPRELANPLDVAGYFQSMPGSSLHAMVCGEECGPAPESL
jgi:hypothetical protein